MKFASRAFTHEEAAAFNACGHHLPGECPFALPPPDAHAPNCIIREVYYDYLKKGCGCCNCCDGPNCLPLECDCFDRCYGCGGYERRPDLPEDERCIHRGAGQSPDLLEDERCPCALSLYRCDPS